MKKLELTDKEKEVAGKAAKTAFAGHNDGFWQGVQKEVDRLAQQRQPAIKPRALK